jgi:predicted nuclease of predicted toxin-antitoxin system
MKLVLDMNLSPAWVEFFAAHGIDAVHWSQVGDPRATDVALMNWARENGRVIFTHDLDHSNLIATTGAQGPSVLQVRAQALVPALIGSRVLDVLQRAHDALVAGAIVTLDDAAARVRILPIRASADREPG